MTESNALAVREPAFDADQLAVIKATLMPAGSSDAEFKLAIEITEATGLNPFKREIYFTKVKGKFVAITGIDGYRRIAEQDPAYDGMEGPTYSDDGSTWTEAPPSPRPAFARVAVYRKDRRVPFVKVVSMAEFYRAPAPNSGPGPWQTYPAHMLGIVAERHAMREAFATKTEHLTFAEDYTSAGTSEVTVGDLPISRPRLAQLHMLARQLGWGDAERHEAAGVRSFLDLREEQARRLVDEWTVLAYPDPLARDRVQGHRAVAELMGGQQPPDVNEGAASGQEGDAPTAHPSAAEDLDVWGDSPRSSEGAAQVEDEAVTPGTEPGPDDGAEEWDAANVPVQDEPPRSPSPQQLLTQRERGIALFGGGVTGRNRLRLAWKEAHDGAAPPVVEDITFEDMQALIEARLAAK